MSNRSFRSSPIGELVGRVTRPAFRKRGFMEEKLLHSWPLIIGEELARHTVPTKLAIDRYGRSGAKLHVICEPAWATELLYLQPVILEKIASFAGYRAVESLVITQQPLPARPASASTSKTAPDQTPLDDSTNAQLDTIADEDIRNALKRLALSRRKGNT